MYYVVGTNILVSDVLAKRVDMYLDVLIVALYITDVIYKFKGLYYCHICH